MEKGIGLKTSWNAPKQKGRGTPATKIVGKPLKIMRVDSDGTIVCRLPK
jgi:hypothetical protein